jgi:hypothetical protein
MAPRVRVLGYVSAGVLMLLGVICAAAVSGGTGETVGILLVATGGLQLITLLMLEKRPPERAAARAAAEGRRAQAQRREQIRAEEEERHGERLRHESTGHEPSSHREPGRRTNLRAQHRRPRRPK